jgi:TP901 family phage tail tape measure protein
MSGDTKQVGVYAETSSGKFVNLTESLKKTDGSFRLTKTSMKETTSIAANGNDVFANWANSIGQLASRALLTIPIWMALRGVVMGIIQGISGGFNSFIELDRALNKARVAAGGTIEQMKKEIATLKPFMEKLAQETGQSVKDLGEVFFSFRATGLDFETSMAGMDISNKIARTQMGDIKNVAESLAKVMLLLGDSFESGGSSIDKMNTFAALSYELNTKNAFSIDQLTDSMLSFAPSAKTAGLSAEQALKLMATVNSAGIMASAAGRTMGTGLSKFILNFKELIPLLGIKIDPKVGTYNALMLTLEALKRLNAEGTLNPQFTKAVNDLFGGERGGKTIKALVSIYDLLKANNEMTGDVKKLTDAYNETNESISITIDKFHQIRDAAFRAFVTGVIGGEDFKSSVKKFNDELQKSLGLISEVGGLFGSTIPTAGVGIAIDIENSKKVMADLVGSFNDEIKKGLQGQLTVPELKVTLEKLETKTAKAVFAPGTIEQLKKNFQAQLNDGRFFLKSVDMEPTVLPEKKFLQAGSEQEKVAKQELDHRLKLLKLAEATNTQLATAKTLYTDELGIILSAEEANQNRLDLEMAIVEETKHLTDLQKSGVITNQLEFLKLLGASNLEITKQKIEFEKISNIHQTEIDLINNRLELDKAITEEQINLDRVQKTALIDNQLEILRLQGATNMQLVGQRIELERMYGINQTKTDLLKNELSLNQEITKEKYNQNKVSSDSVRLFEIAQKYGNREAERAAEFLRGEISPKSLEHSDLMPILKEFFASQLEQAQASEFFFEGAGQNISIPERRAIEEFRPIQLEKFKLPDIKTDIGQINVEIKKMFKEEDTAKQILDALILSLRTNTDIENIINDKIDNF